MDDESCLACGVGLLERVGDVVGFVAGTVFPILECDACGSQSAAPGSSSPEGLYEAIYRHAAELPGYYRYGDYADAVENHRRPLYYLSRTEEMYWGAYEVLQERARDGRGTDVVDVGCGLGYLTAALRREGYVATGIDVSAEAVTRASQRFGPWFVEADATQLAGTDLRPDVMLAFEIIEHVERPADFVRSLTSALAPGGELVISTPNKDRSTPGTLWSTDQPPVHLHWFSAMGVAAMAGARAGCSVEFVDFTEYNRMMGRFGEGWREFETESELLDEPVLDEHLAPLRPRAAPIERALRYRLAREPRVERLVTAVRSARARRRSRSAPSSRTKSIVARLTKAA